METTALPVGTTSLDDKVEAVKELVKDIDFDVGLAIALAGCAFEAYNDPTGVSPHLREIAVNGTAVTYINQCATLPLCSLPPCLPFPHAALSSHTSMC